MKNRHLPLLFKLISLADRENARLCRAFFVPEFQAARWMVPDALI